jgi:hypothetical protein
VKSFSWQFVTLALGTFAMMLGVSVWLIAANYAPPSLLIVPFTTIVTAGAAYVKGKFELPPWLDDPKINAMVRSQPPPPGTPAFAPFRTSPLEGSLSYRIPVAARAPSVPDIEEGVSVGNSDPEVKP